MKSSRTDSNFCVSMSEVKTHFRSLALFSFVDTHFSNLVWFHTQTTALLGRYSVALASPTPWGFQDNPDFIASPSQVHIMASQGLHVGTPLILPF